MNYDKKNNDVAFRDSDHAYFNLKHPEYTYTSVTTLIGKYHEKFDSDFFSKYKALEKLADPNVFKSMKPKMLSTKKWSSEFLEEAEVDENKFESEVERILLEWKLINEESCAFGTEYHLQRENEWYEKANVMVSKKVPVQGDFTCVKNDFSLNRYKAVIPEFLAYYSCPDKILHLAGQVDLLIKDGNDIYILDYKTNKKGIEDKAYFDRRLKTTKKMFYPLSNVEDTTLNHYTIQLSLYAWMLQKINPEFNICMLKLLHIDREGVETEYEVPYLKTEVERLLSHYKKDLKTQMFRKDTYNLV